MPEPRRSRKADRPTPEGGWLIYRHPVVVRVTHWVNVAVVVVLLMSGLNILAAHPHLYWGVRSTFADPWLSFGEIPAAVMIPQGRDLASGRLWHFAFAWLFVLNGLIYLLYLTFTGRLARRIWPTRDDLAGFWQSVGDHARLRFDHGETARRYNVLQKISYAAMILVVLPMMLVTGLSMSPGFNAIGGVLLELMGGRQSARTLHFLSAGLIVAFIVVHVVLVIWTGVFNNMRAMTTGWFAIRPSSNGDERR
jgi:thiosulfate reductase cytochrome b subunit